jgi:hypothetical protein
LSPKTFRTLSLEAFGNKETTIKSLRTGASNRSDLGGVLRTNNIHIATCGMGQVASTLTDLKESPTLNFELAPGPKMDSMRTITCGANCRISRLTIETSDYESARDVFYHPLFCFRGVDGLQIPAQRLQTLACRGLSVRGPSNRRTVSNADKRLARWLTNAPEK